MEDGTFTIAYITKTASQVYCDKVHKWEENSAPVVFTWRTSWQVSAVYLHLAVARLNKGHVEHFHGFTSWFQDSSEMPEVNSLVIQQSLHLGSWLWLPGGQSLCFEISYSEAEWVTKHHKVKNGNNYEFTTAQDMGKRRLLALPGD